MALHIYDTLSRSLQPVVPADGQTLGFYCCGPTVYGPAHIGNFRTFVLQDVFRRTAELSGLKVKHVRNLTNVDDKTIRQAVSEGKSLQEVTEFWTEKFHQDCQALNLLPPAVEPGAVEHIQEQIDLIQSLMEKGAAYRTDDGSVFFRLEAFPEYGRLSGVQDRELTTDSAPSTDDEYGRESLADFALWKAAKPEDGENVWESPWGPGRPGWHLECSAMSMKYLGPSFDVHSGGIDLAFPHHENEIAQSEACTGKPFARLWLHVVHLMVDGKKMSKSLGNLYTLDDLAEKGWSAMEVRYALIAGHYRKHLNFTFDTLRAARSNLKRLASVAAALPDPQGVEPGRFAPAIEALMNNLNVPQALGELFRQCGEIEKSSGLATPADAAGFYQLLTALGLSLPEEETAEIPEEIRKLAEERMQARAQKDFAESDRLRDALRDAGWVVKDVAGGYELEPTA
jgi:cysteinyl-tRNA synthetase